MKKSNLSKKINWKDIVWVIILIGVCMAMLFLNRTLPFFPSDEGDNFLGGKMVAHGLDVYKEFSSQHMPVLYYICAIFYLLGASTVIQFRLFFYAFLCVIWGAMYFRYKDKFGRITMTLYPLLYICAMRFTDFGYCVLSEQLWAQGMVILLLEYLIYTKEKKVSLPAATWISFSIFISFGTAFMAAASIGVIFLGVVYSEIVIQNRAKNGIGKGITQIWMRNRMLILIILIPFLVLISWYLISGNLYNAYYGSFVVNREYYPKYLTYIQSTSGSLVQCFQRLKDWIWYTEQTETYFQIMALGIFLLSLIWKRQYSVSIVVFFFVAFCAIREIDHYHALQFHAVIMLMVALLIGELIQKYFKPKLANISKKEQIVYKCAAIVAVAVLFFPFYRPYYEAKDNFVIQENESVDLLPEGYQVIDELVGENEKVYECILNPWYYLATDTLPAAISAVCPWIYEAYHDEILEDLKREKPKVVSYIEDFEVWGHKFSDFAADICQYFDENYTLLDGYTQLYVRNDCYEEAMALLAE